jgi:DNA-binding CsgD family transcriptional regulator/pimeloyl-ACP methyl ester carboxylesterase
VNAPPVQYVTTSDGYSIAYAVKGTGLPFIFMPGPANHIQLFSTSQGFFYTNWLGALSTKFRLIQYDGRGQGMSQRNLSSNYSMDAMCRDLEAVVSRLELDQFILMGSHASGHTAVRYTIENPGHVHALVLAPCAVSGLSWSLISALDLARSNWDFFLSTWQVGGDHSTRDEKRASLARLKQCITQEDWEIMATTWSMSNIEAFLPNLSIPTLLLHPRDYLNVPPDASLELASRIANAQIALIGGRTPLGDENEGIRAIEDFLNTLPSPGQAAYDFKRADAARLERLSSREVEVLRLIAAGKSNPQIAEELVISLNTVQRHVSNILAKTGAANRTEAAGYARDRGLA